jgi:hypothetical protein
MKRKSFKTVTGYLNNMVNQIATMEYNAGKSGRPLDYDSLQRQSLNNLLSQFGVSGIEPTEKPQDGIARLHAAETDLVKVKKLDEILYWYKRNPDGKPVHWTVTSGGSSTLVVTPGPTTTTYLHYGFSREDTKKGFVIVLDDTREDDRWEQANKIAGPNNCLTGSSNIFHAVPEDLKGRMLSEEELYARVPELDPKYRPPRRA